MRTRTGAVILECDCDICREADVLAERAFALSPAIAVLIGIMGPEAFIAEHIACIACEGHLPCPAVSVARDLLALDARCT